MREALLIFSLVAFAASEGSYRDASIDGDKQLHIVLDNGQEALAPMLRDQVAFSSAAISPDHRTVGWLAEYFIPGNSYPLSMGLVLYRSGRIFHIFGNGEVIWDWRFEDNGRRVAYSDGPTHGGAIECMLVQSSSGKVIARWSVDPRVAVPGWAQSLRR